MKTVVDRDANPTEFVRDDIKSEKKTAIPSNIPPPRRPASSSMTNPIAPKITMPGQIILPPVITPQSSQPGTPRSITPRLAPQDNAIMPTSVVDSKKTIEDSILHSSASVKESDGVNNKSFIITTGIETTEAVISSLDSLELKVSPVAQPNDVDISGGSIHSLFEIPDSPLILSPIRRNSNSQNKSSKPKSSLGSPHVSKVVVKNPISIETNVTEPNETIDGSDDSLLKGSLLPHNSDNDRINTNGSIQSLFEVSDIPNSPRSMRRDSYSKLTKPKSSLSSSPSKIALKNVLNLQLNQLKSPTDQLAQKTSLINLLDLSTGNSGTDSPDLGRRNSIIRRSESITSSGSSAKTETISDSLSYLNHVTKINDMDNDVLIPSVSQDNIFIDLSLTTHGIKKEWNVVSASKIPESPKVSSQYEKQRQSLGDESPKVSTLKKIRSLGGALGSPKLVKVRPPLPSWETNLAIKRSMSGKVLNVEDAMAKTRISSSRTLSENSNNSYKNGYTRESLTNDGFGQIESKTNTGSSTLYRLSNGEYVPVAGSIIQINDILLNSLQQIQKEVQKAHELIISKIEQTVENSKSNNIYPSESDTNALISMEELRSLEGSVIAIRKVITESVIRHTDMFDNIPSKNERHYETLKSNHKPSVVVCDGYNVEYSLSDDIDTITNEPTYISDSEPIVHFTNISRPFKDKFLNNLNPITDEVIFLGVDSNNGSPVCLTLRKTKDDNLMAQYFGLFWTTEGVFEISFDIERSDKIIKYETLAYIALSKVYSTRIHSDTRFQTKSGSFMYRSLQMKQVDNLNSSICDGINEKLIRLESQQKDTNYKFGIVYAKQGQYTEDDMLNNNTSSPRFDEFLEYMGEKIKLKDWQGFKGGLDVKTQTTGEYSIYRNFRGIEIMYHVSTLLPYESTKSTSEEIHASSNSSKTSKTQHIRKKFIGNNICAIVFYDGDTSFAVDTIATNTCQVFAVIRPIINSRNDTENGSSKENQNGSDVIGYSLSLCMKNGIPESGPALPCTNFAKTPSFFDLLICKLINAHNSAYRTAEFEFKIQRIRNSFLNDLIQTYTPSLIISTSLNTTMNGKSTTLSSGSFTVNLDNNEHN